jgi:hypothetical protein
MALPPPKRVELGALYSVLGRNIIRSGPVHDLPETWVTVYTGDMGNSFGPKEFFRQLR